MAEFPPVSDFQAETEKNRLDSLRVDLKLSSTFADLAMTELRMEHHDAARRALAKAEDGYATVARLLLDVTNPDYRNEVEPKLNGLRTKLDYVQSQFRAAT